MIDKEKDEEEEEEIDDIIDDVNTILKGEIVEDETVDATSIALQDALRIDDDPINRKTVMDVTIEQLDHMIEGIQTRRLTIIRTLEERARVKTNMADMNRFVMFNKKVATIRKKCDTVTETLDKLESEINKLRALRLAIEE